MGAGAVVDRHASRRNTHTDSDHYGETNMGDRKTTLVRLCGTRGSSSKHNNSTCGVNTHTQSAEGFKFKNTSEQTASPFTA